jgi:hypothetical protein
MTMEIADFWDEAPFSLVQTLGGTFSFHCKLRGWSSTLKMEAADFSETLLPLYNTKGRLIQGDSNLRNMFSSVSKGAISKRA